VARLPYLEVTPLTARNIQVEATRMPELDVHRAPRVPALPVTAVPELERTRHASLPEVPVAPVPELEGHRAPSDGIRTAAPGDSVVCRYCRNVQATGMLCDRCGMRLSRVKVAAATPRTNATGQDDGYARCPLCRQVQALGKKCKECGTLVVLSEE
jgi:hypothetical protein